MRRISLAALGERTDSRDEGGKQEAREQWRGKRTHTEADGERWKEQGHGGIQKVTWGALVTDGSAPSRERQYFTDPCLPSP